MGKQTRATVSALALGLVCVLPASVSAQSLAEGRELYLDAEFRPAMAVFTSALERDDLTDAELAQIHSYLAALSFLAEDQETAREHATAAILVDANVPAPEGAPEALRALLDDVSDRYAGVGGAPLISISADVDGDESTVEARVHPELEALVTELVLRCVAPESGVESVTGAPAGVRLTFAETRGSIHCVARGTSRRGELLRSRRELELRGTERRRTSRRVWLGVGIGLGAAAVTALAVGLALAFRSDDYTIGNVSVEGW